MTEAQIQVAEVVAHWIGSAITISIACTVLFFGCRSLWRRMRG